LTDAVEKANLKNFIEAIPLCDNIILYIYIYIYSRRTQQLILKLTQLRVTS